MIKLEAVQKIYNARGAHVVAVDDFNLEIAEGETFCLIGASGCGKTTVLEMINRLVEPSAGRIIINNRDIEGMDTIRLRRSIGYVTQKGGLFPHLTVARNVGLPCRLEHWTVGDTARRVETLLSMVGLETYGNRYPRELSGGQQQRVSIARALALDPSILLMDEPFGALDPITRRELHTEFISLEQEMKKTIVLVTHDLSEAFMLGDRLGLMNHGCLVQVGGETDFKERPASDFVSKFIHAHQGGPLD